MTDSPFLYFGTAAPSAEALHRRSDVAVWRTLPHRWTWPWRKPTQRQPVAALRCRQTDRCNWIVAEDSRGTQQPETAI